MVKLSIIVPVFNAEPFLTCTFNSILSQNIDKSLYEVIVVNDGSTDSSLKIIQDFEAIFLNYKYFSQQNKGVSAARNKALEHVSGEYVMFLDADDTLRNHSLSQVWKTVNNNTSDIYLFDKSYPSQQIKYKQTDFLSEVYFSVYVWKTCIKFNLIKENNLKFPEGYILEDGVFLLEAILKASEICTSNFSIVNYKNNKKSLMRDFSDKKKNNHMISSFIFVINKYHLMINEIKDDVIRRVYNNLTERKESFLFFMYFRMVRYKFSNQQIEENLQKAGFQPFTLFPGQHYTEIKYKILSMLIRKRLFRNLFNSVYRMVR